MKFREMNIPEFLLRALDKLEIFEPTKVQEKTIPQALAKKDIIVKSKRALVKLFLSQFRL